MKFRKLKTVNFHITGALKIKTQIFSSLVNIDKKKQYCQSFRSIGWGLRRAARPMKFKESHKLYVS